MCSQQFQTAQSLPRVVPKYRAFGDRVTIVFGEADPPFAHARMERSPLRLVNTLPIHLRLCWLIHKASLTSQAIDNARPNFLICQSENSPVIALR